MTALVARVLARGVQNVLPFLMAIWLGEAIWLSLGVVGLAALAASFQTAFQAIKWPGPAPAARGGNTLMQARKKRRLYLVLTCGLCLCAATGLMLAAFSSTLTYFLSPRQVLVKDPAPGVDFRLGGIIQVGTVNTKIAAGSDAPTTSFRVTDGQASVPVTFTGVLRSVPRRPGRGGDRRHDRQRHVRGQRRAGQARFRLHAQGRGTGAETGRQVEPDLRAAPGRLELEHDAGEKHELMIPELGHFALALAVALAFAQGVVGIFAPGLRDPRAMRATPALAISHLLAIGVSLLCLIYAGIVSDFTVENVADFSSSAVPLLYRITGTWGNHDGSILLWCLILSLCGLVVALFGASLPASLRARVLGVLGLVSGGFLLFTLTVSDPLPGSGRRRCKGRA